MYIIILNNVWKKHIMKKTIHYCIKYNLPDIICVFTILVNLGGYGPRHGTNVFVGDVEVY